MSQPATIVLTQNVYGDQPEDPPFFSLQISGSVKTQYALNHLIEGLKTVKPLVSSSTRTPWGE